MAVPPAAVVDQPTGAAAGRRDHRVLFAESDDHLARAVASYLVEGLGGGEAVLVVATPDHERAIADALRRAGIDVAAATLAGRYTARDASSLLARFLRDGQVDGDAFARVVGGLVARCGAGRRPVRIYGEMVALLWQHRAIGAAIAVEDRWNAVGAQLPFRLLCAYPMGSFGEAGSGAAFARICEAHGEVLAGDGASRGAGGDGGRALAWAHRERAVLRAALDRAVAERDVLSTLAYTDELTGLANRRAFDRRLAAEWERSRAGGAGVVLVADLDRFKAYNDTFGHAAGDDALRRFAGALAAAAPPGAMVARIGGDEFGAVFGGRAAVQAYEDRLQAALAAIAPFRYRVLGASIGHAALATAPHPEVALQRADRAMFERKRGARPRRRPLASLGGDRDRGGGPD